MKIKCSLKLICQFFHGNQQPRSGVFCFLISDVRETTALEMPSRENTFVIKADSSTEYVIEAANPEEMRSWLATIRYCMRSTPTVQLPGSIDPPLTAFPNLTTIPASPPQIQADGSYLPSKYLLELRKIKKNIFLCSSRCNWRYNSATKHKRVIAKQYIVSRRYWPRSQRTNIHIE